MAFWSKVEEDPSKGEIEELHKQIRKYMLEKRGLQLDKESLALQLEKSQTECSGFEKALFDSLDRHMACEDRVMDCQREIKALEAEIKLLENRKTHNERGAGRKSRITPADVSIAKESTAKGKSLAEIARLLSKNSGKHWSRSSVKYLIDKHCKESLEDLND